MSRFYMYDSKTGAYAPVAEFAEGRRKRRSSAPPLREKGGAIVLREPGSSYSGSGSRSSNQKGMGRDFRNNKQPRLAQGSTEAFDVPVNTRTAPGRSPNPYSSSRSPKGTALPAKNLRSAADRTLMNNLVGTSIAGRGARALGALGLVAGAAYGGSKVMKARKKAKAEAAKSPLRKRYESLRSQLGR